MSSSLSPQDLQEAQNLLGDLFKQVSEEEGKLSGGDKLGKGGEALQALRETKVTFGAPTDRLIRLTPKLFEEVGVELNEIYKRQMREQFNFYYMTLAVSMRPKRGAQFTRVECALNFGPKGSQEPIVQAIFPQSEWREVLNFGGGMNLGLNGDLDFGAEVKMPADPAELEKLPAHIKAKIGTKDDLKAFITIPDYSFKLGRAEIAATGEGNSECFWRVEKPDLQEAQTMRFGVVFKVPKDISSIELTGMVAAEPDMKWLTINVRDVLADLSDGLQALFRRKDEREGKERLPIGDHEKWTLALPN